jgi:catechol 2,3-dioxygenase
MPIVKPNLESPFNVVRASHVAFGVRDLDRARAFYVDCLGLLETAGDRDTLYLRGVEERNHHSLVLRQAQAAGHQEQRAGKKDENPLHRLRRPT